MQEAESSQGKDVLNEEVMDSLGSPEEASERNSDESEGNPQAEEEMPLYAKEKIGKLQKRHHRDMRRMQERIDMLSSQLSQPQSSPMSSNSYANPSSDMGGEDERITRAVTAALQHKDMQERKAKEAEQIQYVHNQYRKLQDHLDNAADKYDDFDEVVRADNVPFTPAMREAALLIDNPGEVLYKLGKNRDELNRISKLHPLEQAKEINRLSFALMGGNNKMQAPQKSMGQIKSNPISRDINENTSASEIRARMKAGAWK